MTVDRRPALMLKRLFDIFFAGLALLALSPLIGLICLAIKLDDRGPILFVQERVGQWGTTFDCLKFRTMVVGARQHGRGLEVSEDDERITRVGRFLRAWSLDELPQTLNVLRGDMSVIGPRPTVPDQVARYTPHQARRLEMKPGMAGWAWIHGRNSIVWEERIELDIEYIDNWSLKMDFLILWKAIVQLVRRRGVYGYDGVVRDL